MKKLSNQLAGKTLFWALATKKNVPIDSKYILALEMACTDSFIVVKLLSLFTHTSLFSISFYWKEN